MRHLDKVANLAIVVAVLIFLGVVARKEIGWREAPHDPAQGLVGKTINLPGAQLPKDRDSLLLVISTTCHFCRESIPFYKELSEQSRGRLNIVAVFPQPPQEALRFLQDAGVGVNTVISSSPDSVGVNGTPTILLVDRNGRITQAWTGLLDERHQADLLAFALPKKAG